MRQVTVTDSPTELVPAGVNYDFIHIANADGANKVYLKYDGDATAVSDSGAAGGIPLAPGGIIQLNNYGPRNIFNGKAVQAVCASTETADIRIQGYEA